jgi:ABC-type glycerol-3-phosphate transport system permease component
MRLSLARADRRRRRLRVVLGYALAYVVLTCLGLVFALPFYWMVRTSLMRSDMIMAPGFQFVPNPIMWENYVEVLRVGLVPDQPLAQSLFLQWVKNSIIVTFFAMVGDVAGSTLAAYGFSRVHFPGRNVLFGVVLATLMVPFHVTLVPQYVIFWKLGWINTLFPLIIPFLGGRAIYIFILRQFFMTLPFELDEAAYIDGASRFRVLWQILLPLSKPAIGTVMAFSFIENWNEFLRPLIFLNSAENLTLSVGIRWFVHQSGSYFHLMMGASTLALLPVIIVFFAAQKQFVRGIALTGIK